MQKGHGYAEAKHVKLPEAVWNAGAQIPLEDVPSVQKEVVVRCRQQGKPVIIASHLLQSMMEFPTPTRAEVLSTLLCWPDRSNTVCSGCLCTYFSCKTVGF